MSKNLSDIFPPTEIGGGNPEWDDIQNKPSEFPPSGHTHLVADITDFDPADYQPVGNYATEQYVDDAVANIDLSAGSLWEQNGSDIYYEAGNVGIGTDNPSSKLDIVHSNNNPLRLQNSTGVIVKCQLEDNATRQGEIALDTGAITFSNGTGSVTERMRIEDNGNVGIFGAISTTTAQNTGGQIRISNSTPRASGNKYGIRFADSSFETNASIYAEQKSSGNNAADLVFGTNNSTGGTELTSATERMRIDSSGNVGIGTQSPFIAPLQTSLSINGTAYGRIDLYNEGKKHAYMYGGSGNAAIGAFGDSVDLAFETDSTERMRIDAQGRVGIGGEPSRSAVDIAKEAKDTLARWKSSFDARLREEPKADKKAVTLEITGGEFDTFPTESKLVERLTERDIGGGDAKLQVAGDGYFSGTVNATTINGKVTDVADHIKAITPTQIANWDAGTGGGGGGATTDGRISDNDIIHWNEAYGWGNHASAGYQPAGSYADANHTHSQYLTSSSLNGYATESWVTSGYQPKGSYADASHTHAYVPLSGNSTITGTLTCTGDVIAYSDQRLKDNVETLDGSKVFEMRGVSYTRDGKESSGVIAQELQKVAPELVHDDGEHLGVAYGNLVGYLIEAVKELKAEIEELKNG